MLKEYKDVKQNPGSKRRWFSDSSLDLTVWYDEKGALFGFQLCYDIASQPHAFTFKPKSGLTHEKIDTGEGDPRKNLSPLLVPDGTPPLKRVIDEFIAKSKDLEEDISTFVLDKLKESFYKAQ